MRTRQIQKRLNAMLDAAVHEISVSWHRNSAMPAMTEDEENVAIAAALGGLVMVIEESFRPDQRALARRLAQIVHHEVTNRGGLSHVTDAYGVPFALSNKSADQA